MTLRHTLALSFAAALIAAGFATTATAATTATTTPHRHAVSHTHTVAAHTHMHGKPIPAATGPDHSADALNAQSLSRAQGATQ